MREEWAPRGRSKCPLLSMMMMMMMMIEMTISNQSVCLDQLSGRMNREAVEPVILDNWNGERGTNVLPRMGPGRILHKPTYLLPGFFRVSYSLYPWSRQTHNQLPWSRVRSLAELSRGLKLRLMIGDASFVGLVRITILRIVVFDDLNVDPLLMMSSIMIGPTVRFFTSLFLPLEKPFGFFSCWECFIVWMSLQLWLAFF